MILPPAKSDIVAVVVTYHPSDMVTRNVTATLCHADRVCVIDNTPGDAPAVLEQLGGMPGVEVHRMGRNAGIASALNRGLTEALGTAGCEWVLLLDQDTVLWPSYGDVVRRAVRAAGPRVGMVGVNFINDQSGRPYIPPAMGITDVPFVVNSGTMLRTACVQEIGGFRDDFFIDYVDIEYGLRARRHGYGVVLSSEVAMDHGMAEVAENRVLGYTRQTSNYRPVRHYYMARNFVVTARAYARTETAWLRREVVQRLKLTALTLAMEPHRRGAIVCMARGYLDGLRGRMGEAPPALSR